MHPMQGEKGKGTSPSLLETPRLCFIASPPSNSGLTVPPGFAAAATDPSSVEQGIQELLAIFMSLTLFTRNAL